MASELIRHGKVRDIYSLDENLLLVASDRISAFDWVLPTAIPDKGRVLTQISKFWFDHLEEPNHLLRMEPTADELPTGSDPEWFAGRSMVVKKCTVIPVECVVRGYLVGSGWQEYQNQGTVCGIQLPAAIQNCQQLAEPLFTPATKAEEGHDENIPFDQMAAVVGRDKADELRRRSIDLYLRGAAYARERGIIIADTKFEWGEVDGELILIDEVMTPDSSRFWPAESYAIGSNPPSYDKQFVRDWLSSTDWDKNSEPPALPDEIVAKTREKYIQAFEQLTERSFAWK